MKFLRSIIFAFALFFLTAPPLFAAPSYAYILEGECDDNESQKVDCIQTLGGQSCPGKKLRVCRNGLWKDWKYYPCLDIVDNCPTAALPPGNGGGGENGGGDGDGDVSTNIDAQAQGFFAYQSFDKFLPNLLQIALILGAIAAFAFLIWGGIDYIISGGNQERVKTSKTMIGNALTGLAILAAAWVLWRLTTYFLGLSPTLKGPFDIKLPTP